MELQLNKADYVKQSWDYITETIKYLKSVSSNQINGPTRQAGYADVSTVLAEIAALDATQLVVDKTYFVKGYSSIGFAGIYKGIYRRDNLGPCLLFEVIYADEEKFHYKLLTDKFELSLDQVLPNHLSFSEIVITREELPMLMDKPFKGLLFDKLLKSGSSSD